MRVDGIKTDKICVGQMNLQEFLDKYIKELKEKTVLVFASTVIAILEGRVVPMGSIDKADLIKRESDLYLDREISKYKNAFTITKGTLISAAGIDESNGDGHYVLWPKNPMASAAAIRDFLVKKFSIKKLGVIVCDSTVMPLRRGTVGIMIGWSGFKAIKSWVGEKDLFGREFKMSVVAVGTNLAVAGNTIMGEGTEQTPIAVITGAPAVEFLDRSTITGVEYQDAFIDVEDDLFAPFLLSQDWKRNW